MTLVVDASVGLKWILEEPDSRFAHALVCGDEPLLVPDFWLNEATNVLWLQVRRRILNANEAREGLALIKELIEPTPTAAMGLHDVALDIGLAVNQSTYDTLYLAFTVAMGARGLVLADGPFATAMTRHQDPLLTALMLPLQNWAESKGLR